MNKLFSILLPVYNRENVIAGCLDSILSQRFLNYEIIAVDDGSTDRSLQIMNEFDDERFVLIAEGHKGYSSARNAAINRSTGSYLIFMDAEDRLRDGFLDECCKRTLISKGRMIITGRSDHDFTDVMKTDPFMNTVNAKVYDAKIIKENGLRFTDGRDNELQFNRGYLELCGGVIACPKAEMRKDL